MRGAIASSISLGRDEAHPYAGKPRFDGADRSDPWRPARLRRGTERGLRYSGIFVYGNTDIETREAASMGTRMVGSSQMTYTGLESAQTRWMAVQMKKLHVGII